MPAFLSGIKVLDFTRVISGPYCTMMLADMGADVVKVEERVRGDEMRHIIYEGRGPDDQDYFYSVNRSKRSIALDLKDERDLQVALRLATKADIIVENYAPGVADRLGIGCNALRSLNANLIYCSISGFGQSGPYRSRPALDPVIQALSGVMSVTGREDQEPLHVGAPIADVIAGMFGAYAIVAACVDRLRGGSGGHIDVSMLDSMVAVLAPRMAEALQAGRNPRRHGNGNPMRVPTNTYLTKDGRYLMLCVLNDRHWRPLCRALERPDWLARAEYQTMPGRRQHRQELDRLIAAEMQTRDASDWEARFEEQGVPFGVVNDYLQAIEDRQIDHRGLIREVEHPKSGVIRVIGPPWQVTGYAAPVDAPPLLDQHKADVLTDWLGEKAQAANSVQAIGAREPATMRLREEAAGRNEATRAPNGEVKAK